MGLLVLIGLVLVSEGLFTIDEFSQLAGARALATGSFAVVNGGTELNSPQLVLWTMVAVPTGLVPQYPVGPAVLAAPLINSVGATSLVMQNVIAGIGTIFASYLLSQRHFGGARVANIALSILLLSTFFLEYTYGIWPHGTAVFFATATFLCLFELADSRTDSIWLAIVLGLVAGAGILFRTDAVLILPIIGLVFLLYSDSPIRSMLLVGIGVAPSVAIVSILNKLRFGTYNPLSYGQDHGGGTSLSGHLPTIFILVAGGLVVLGARRIAWTPGKLGWTLILALGLSVLATVPVVRNLLLAYIDGAWSLFGDMRNVHDTRIGVARGPADEFTYYGLVKKAAGQSMPWIGLLALVPFVVTGRVRRSAGIALIAVFIWTLPFCVLAWHGGMTSNMRYFLPIVPLTTALVGAAISFLWSRPQNPRLVILSGGAIASVLFAFWVYFHPTGFAGVQQILATYMLVTAVICAVLSGILWKRSSVVHSLALGVGGACFFAAFVFATFDFVIAQERREQSVMLSEANANLPDRTLVYAPARNITQWIFKPGHYAALPSSEDGHFDANLIEDALSKGFRVLIWETYANERFREEYSGRISTSEYSAGGLKFLEINPAVS